MRANPAIPELVVVGHVARDHIGRDIRLGGAASFAAQAAAALGVRTGVVTVAPDSFALLAPVARDPHVTIQRKASAKVTTFELDYSGPRRQVRLLARAPDIRPSHIPPSWRGAALAYVAPVIGECGAEVIAALGASRVVVGAQGWLRAVGSDGRVVPALAPEARHPPKGLYAVVFSELDHPDAEALARRFAERTPIVALTRGARGATLYDDGCRHHVPADGAHEIDPTGAGDVFGLVLGLATRHGATALDAAALAARAAARVVEGPGIGKLPEFCASEAWRQLRAA
ncbi:MAG: carbohydrate kinase [Deltaproteobacteria bacterium]|nr:carbohydrate kinase [Deltaproteobacteria bacterium]